MQKKQACGRHDIIQTIVGDGGIIPSRSEIIDFSSIHPFGLGADIEYSGGFIERETTATSADERIAKVEVALEISMRAVFDEVSGSELMNHGARPDDRDIECYRIVADKNRPHAVDIVDKSRDKFALSKAAGIKARHVQH